MTSLILRNIIFTILKPGVVVGLIPFLILREDWDGVGPFSSLNHYLGLLLITAGLIILLHCIIRFASEGRGTLSPIDPTKRLVLKGLYKYSRNPMYLGVLSILVGESLFTRSIDLWIYTLIVSLAFNIFVIFIEEPRLKKDFGEEYKHYFENVRRWI